MKIERSQVTKLVIKDVPRLDPITLYAEDLGPNHGKMTVECYGRSWSAYWGGMGGTLDEFLRRVSADYLTGCLARGAEIQRSVYDPGGLEAMLKREVIKERRVYLSRFTKQRAREIWSEIEDLDFEHPFHIRSNLLVELIGDDWHCALPEKINPDWQYLHRIMEVVHAAYNEQTEEAPHGR